MTILTYAAVLLIAYLLGAFPAGYLTAKIIRRVDVTAIGSGHTGGTNVFRSAGPVAGGITIVLDLAKGYAAAAIAQLLVPDAPVLIALAGTLAILGHNYSIFLGFRGGVGTMATLGVALALMPISAGVAVLFGIVIILISRYTSLGSLTVAALLPLACLAGALLGWCGCPCPRASAGRRAARGSAP